MTKPPPEDLRRRFVVVVLAQAKTNTLRPRLQSSARSTDQLSKPTVRTRVTDKLRQQVVNRYQAGNISAQAVAEELGIGKATVLRILKQADVPVRPHGQRIT